MQFIDLGAQRARISGKIDAAVAKVIADGRYILGPEVAEFEKRLGEYIGVEHVVACANGTDALLIPLKAYDIGHGDAVFCQFHFCRDSGSGGADRGGAGVCRY
jgi:dTDP-4-amino-4,6-dideoxygalactose transaminase